MKLFNKKWFIFLLLIPFIKLPLYVTGETIDKILDIYLIVISILLIIIYIRNNTLSKALILFFILQIIPVFSTFYNQNTIMLKTSITNLISVIDICIVFEIGIKVNKQVFFQTCFYFFGFMLLINSITFLIYYPIGMDQGIYVDPISTRNFYFLGHDNGSIFYMIPTFFCGFIYNIIRYKKVKKYLILYTAFIVFTYIYIHSVNAAIIGILILLYELLYKNDFVKKIVNLKWFTIIFIFAYICVVLLRSNVDFLGNFLKMLDRDFTFSGRIYIWDKAINYIKQKPLLGYGLETSSILIAKFGFSKLHNMILQIIYNGGFLAFGIFILILKKCSKKLKEAFNSDIVKCCTVFLFLYMIAGLFDYYINRFLCLGILITIINLKYFKNIVRDEKTCEQKVVPKI